MFLKLDRPWLETPFLFQGFYIENEEVLPGAATPLQVRLYRCDASRRFAPPAEPGTRAGAESQERRGAAQSQASVPPRAHDGHVDTAVLKKELARAQEAHVAAERVIADVYQNVRAGKDVDIASIHRTLDPMIESIMRNDDALSWLVRMKRKDDYIYSHSIASAVWALVFGKHLGLNAAELQVLATGAVFMDVG